MKKSLKIFELFVAFLISAGFVYLFYKVIGFDKLIQFFKQLSIFDLLIAFFFYTLSYITRAFRWFITLHIKDFLKLFKITVYNTVFNIFMPFRTGELSFFYMLKKENLSFSESLLPFITVRLFDGFSLIAVFVFSFLLYKQYIGLSIVTLLLFPFFIFSFFRLATSLKIKKFNEFSKTKLSIKNILTLYLLSVFTLIFKFTGFLFVLPESLNLSLSELFLASSAGDLTTVLPIHGIAGIGTYEGGFAGLLILLGADKDTALLSSTMVHIFLLLSSLILAFISFVFLRKR